MSRTKLAAAYVASQQLSALSKMDFSREKKADIDMDDVEAYIPTAAAHLLNPYSLGLASPITTGVLAPEGRGTSRVLHTVAGGALGGLGGGLLGGLLTGNANIGKSIGILGGLGGGLKGLSMSREADPLYMKALRELGVDAYQY